MEELYAQHGWIGWVFGVVLLTLIIHFIVFRIYKRVHPRLKKTHSIWDDILVQALHKPLGWIIWVIGIAFAGEIAAKQVAPTQEGTREASQNIVLENIDPVRNVAIIFLFTWFIFRFITLIERRLIAGGPGRAAKDKTTVRGICQLVRAAVVITAILVVLQSLDIKITGILAFGGVGTIIIGLAAKDMLGNFFGGFMIFLDRPFKVGDWVCSPDKQIEGTVEHIGWRLTRIRKFDKRPLYVPNGTFSTISVENPSRMSNRQIKTEVGIRYDDASKMGVIVKDVEEMIRNHPEIDLNQTCFVRFHQFGPSSLNFQIYTFTKTTDWIDWLTIQQEIYLKVIDIVESHGAECAFPTTTLHVPERIQIQTGS